MSLKAKISRETPFSEITLRKYEKPGKAEGRDIYRKLLLSLGLLQPGDSRDIIVDIFMAIHQHKTLTPEQIESTVKDLRKKHNLALLGVAPSNIRRQLKRLKDSLIIEKAGEHYRMTEHMTMEEIFTQRIEKFTLTSISGRVKEYCHAIDSLQDPKG